MTRIGKLRKRIKGRLQKTLRELPLLTGGERRADLNAFRRAAARPRPLEPGSYRVILAAPGGGNIGDQALLEATIENTPGELRVIVSRDSEVDIPEQFADRVRVITLPHLVYGYTGTAHRADVQTFIRLLLGATGFAVIGADIMDGRYTLRAAVRRSTLAHGAALLGVDSRIIGFSWSGKPRWAAARALRAATRAGVVPYLRDPASAQRAREDGMRGVVETADIVFTATTVENPELDVPAPYALLNASALIARRHDQTPELVPVIRYLREQGLHVVIVPHVSVPSADDFAPCRALASAAGEGVTLVDRILTPSEVRALAEGATVTVTGRMHLAVMSMTRHVPAVTLATQGKVEGMMRLLGTPELCVEPGPGMGRTIIEVLGRVLPGDSETRRAIVRNLPAAVELARRSTDEMAEAS